MWNTTLLQYFCFHLGICLTWKKKSLPFFGFFIKGRPARSLLLCPWLFSSQPESSHTHGLWSVEQYGRSFYGHYDINILLHAGFFVLFCYLTSLILSNRLSCSFSLSHWAARLLLKTSQLVLIWFVPLR